MVRTLAQDREDVYRTLESQVGNTPLHEVRQVSIPNRNRIYAKEEYKNPTSSTFDRLYPYLFRIAEESGLIVPRITPVIEASTGNAGASFAWCAEELGYGATVITHKDTPKARVQQIESYGAKVIFSPAGKYAAGYVKELERILAEDKRGKGKLGEDPSRMYCLTKIDKKSLNTPGYQALVDEVLNEINEVDYFIGGVGSGTTISALGKRLKRRNPQTQVIAFEHRDAPVITEFKRGRIAKMPKKFQFFGLSAAGLPPEKLDIDMSIIDDVILVTDEDWRIGYKLLKENEGKEVGRSSCAAFKVALNLSDKIQDKKILILFGDPSWKYTDNYPYLK